MNTHLFVGMDSEHARVAGWHRSLLPQMVDRLARHTPDKLYGNWPVDPTSYDKGISTITYAQLANAVNGLAAWIVEHLGNGHNKRPVGQALAYIGPNDVRSTALLLAAIKAGYVIFFDSPRNSAAAHKSLFNALNCKVLLTDDPTPPPAQLCLEAIEGQAQMLAIPSVQELMSNSYPHFAYDKSYEEARWDPVWVM
jgi:acyl-CoA synthetase (AMP-forming)/AMP-acid ligase II